MSILLNAYDSDDDSEKSPSASTPLPFASSPPPQGSPLALESTTVTNSTTITLNTSVTVVVRKTFQRQSTTSSLISNYGSDSDEVDSSSSTHFTSSDGVIDIVASPKPPKMNNASTVRLMHLLPPEPLGQVDKEIQDKFAGYLKMGTSYNTMLQGMKNFHNPYILNKIAEKYGINQTASNYPPELYDPHEWEKEDYEKIARRQENAMKEKAHHEEKQFVPSSAPPLTSCSSAGPGMRRWDSQPATKKVKSSTQQQGMQHALQVANQLKASLSSGAIDSAAAAAKKEAAARAAVLAKKIPGP